MNLSECIIGEAKILESDRAKLPEGVLCRVKEPVCNVNRLNANKRKYGWDVWEKVCGNKNLTEQIEKRALFGHAEHPATSQSDLQLVSHVIVEWIVDRDNDTVYQTFDVLDTPTGRIVDCMIRAKCGVGVSTRAEGELTEEVDETTKQKYQRVIAESYKYITTDFTADPSTFGAIPIDIKRNVVETIKTAATCKEAKAGDKQFAGAILESMQCKHGKNDKKKKCQNCGCCEAIKEGMISVTATPNSKVVSVAGDVNTVDIHPVASAPGENDQQVNVIITTPEPIPDTTVTTIEPPVDVVGPEDSVEDIPDEEDEEDEDAGGEMSAEIPADDLDGNKKDDEDEIGEKKVNEEVEILDKDHVSSAKDLGLRFGKYIRNISVSELINLFGDPTYPDGADGSEMEWEGEIDSKLFAVVVYTTGKILIQANDNDTLQKVFEYLHLEKQWSQPETEEVPNESKTKTASNLLKEVTQLRIDNATLKVERDRLAESVNTTTDTSLQSKIVVSKIREMRTAENIEVTALRAKLEEKATAETSAVKKLTEAQATINTLNEKVKKLTVGNTKILEENKIRIADVEKSSKTDATRALINEYAGRQLKAFKSVHDNVRALLESCVTIAEVDEVLNEFRDSQRRSALHSNPPKEVTVRVDESQGGDVSVRKRIGLVFDGLGMK